MRIVAGSLRGRQLKRPPDRLTRPTMDRTREGVFNILMHRSDFDMENAYVLDAFAGSGSYGLECLSRGAAHATFVDNARTVTDVVRENCTNLHVMDQSTIITCDVEKLRPPLHAIDLVFLDPPYHKDLLLPSLFHLRATGWIMPHTLVVAEVADKENIESDDWKILLNRRYGQNNIFLLNIV